MWKSCTKKNCKAKALLPKICLLLPERPKDFRDWQKQSEVTILMILRRSLYTKLRHLLSTRIIKSFIVSVTNAMEYPKLSQTHIQYGYIT